MSDETKYRLHPTEEVIVIWEHWFRIIMNCVIDIKNITQIIVEFADTARILKFSKKFKSKYGLYLMDDNKCVQRCKVGSSSTASYRWILADIKPVSKGIHCWRVNAKHELEQKSGWVVYGISPPNDKIRDYVPIGIWGATYSMCFYPTTSKRMKNDHLYKQNLNVDMLLDLDKQTLNIAVVGLMDDKYQIKFSGIEKTNEFGGWCPYFNLYQNASDECTVRCQLRIAHISPKLFGQPLTYKLF
eukprot:359062_1